MDPQHWKVWQRKARVGLVKPRVSYVFPEGFELAHLKEVGQVEDRLHAGVLQDFLHKIDYRGCFISSRLSRVIYIEQIIQGGLYRVDQPGWFISSISKRVVYIEQISRSNMSYRVVNIEQIRQGGSYRVDQAGWFISSKSYRVFFIEQIEKGGLYQLDKQGQFIQSILAREVYIEQMIEQGYIEQVSRCSLYRVDCLPGGMHLQRTKCPCGAGSYRVDQPGQLISS